MQALPKTRALRAHRQHPSRLLLEEVRAVTLTRQVQVALFTDGKLDGDAFRHLSSARRCDDTPPIMNEGALTQWPNGDHHNTHTIKRAFWLQSITAVSWCGSLS
jgi:hypothetical protein